MASVLAWLAVWEWKLHICNQINSLPASKKSQEGQKSSRDTIRLRLRGLGSKLTSVIFFIDQRLVVRRAPIPVGGNLQRLALISHPATIVAFSIERKVSLISCNLLCSLRLSIDFYVYLLTQQNGRGKESQKQQTNKQTKWNIGPIGVFNSQLP